MLAVDFEKRLGDFQLRPRFSAQDELIVLLGPSGAGKSLTLRAIAGLLRPDGGRIELPGGVAFDSASGVDLPPQARSAGYVVQDLALFPHLSVTQNIGFALHRWPRPERESRVAELIEILGLHGLEARLPGSISGGQQQRVALGRALAARPSVLLLDEPFSALDAPVRTAMRREVARLRRELGIVAVFVTHDLQEAYALADSIALYDEGAVVQFGPRDEVFRRPASVRAAQLLDARNIIAGRVAAVNEAFVEVETPWFQGRAQPDSALAVGDAAALVVRPEHVILLRPDRPHANEVETTLDVEIADEMASASSHRLYLRVIGEAGPTDCVLEAEVPSHPYEVMGVASQRRWRVALTLERTVAIGVGTSDPDGREVDTPA
jgi:ABC-type sulfate/molybdate transport systems ATPase subunit